MRTTITVVIPVALRRENLSRLLATVASVHRSQPRFPSQQIRVQVLVVLDGPDVDNLAGRIPARVLYSARSEGHEDLPHRNHARMVGLEHAVGELTMVLDADMLLGPHVLADAALIIQGMETRGELMFLSPCMESIECDPATWSDRIRPMLDGGSLDAALEGLKMGPLYSGHREHFKGGAEPTCKAIKIPEGFPIGRTDIYRAVGFDLAYLGWGGNKEDTTMQLGALKPRISYQLLTSAKAWHQPHPADPQKRASDPIRAANEDMYRRRKADVAGGAAWWTRKQATINDAVYGPKESLMLDKTSVLLVTHLDEARGIARDMEILAEAIESKPTVPGELGGLTARHFKVPGASIGQLENSPNVKDVSGIAFSTALTTCNTVIFSELVPTAAINCALEACLTVVVIPNADWAEVGGDAGAFIAKLCGFAEKFGHRFQVWGKTPEWARELLEAMKVQSAGTEGTVRCIPWITPEQVTFHRNAAQPGSAVRFFANLGFGGWKDRRSGKEIVDAWKRVASKITASLTIKAIGDPEKTVGHSLEELTELGIKYVGERLTRGEVMAMLGGADVVLHPSKWEGFGLGISEALNLGIPVITCDAWPMNEQVKHRHNGLLIPRGKRKGAEFMRMAPRCHPSAVKLAEAIKTIATDHRLLTRLSAPQPAARVAQQVAMRIKVKAAVANRDLPDALVVIPDGKTRDRVRAEHVWVDALVNFGLNVSVIRPSEIRAFKTSHGFDLILCSKLPIDLATILSTECPEAIFVSWHYDPTEWDKPRKKWQTAMAAFASMAFFPEDKPRRYGSKARSLYQPTRSGHDRATRDIAALGVIQRPELLSEDGFSPHEVVWLGTHTGEDSRTKAVKALDSEDGTKMIVRGEGWAGKVKDAGPEVPKEEALELYAGRLGLSISRHVNRNICYTSDRLFNVAGSGAVPLVEGFTGLEDLYPAGTIIPFTSSPAGVIAGLNREDMVRISDRASAHTWRHHTIENRLIRLFSELGKVANTLSDSPNLASCPRGIQWDNIAAREKAKAGSPNAAWPVTKLDDFRRTVWRKVSRHLGAERGVGVDFGCGTGFFANMLRSSGFQAWGLDISTEMLVLAKVRNVGPTYCHMDTTTTVPLAAGTVDVMIAAFVLSYYRGAELEAVADVMKRTLKRNGRLLLVDRIDGGGRPSPSKYESIFPGLAERETFKLDGQTYCVLAGRLP